MHKSLTVKWKREKKKKTKQTNLFFFNRFKMKTFIKDKGKQKYMMEFQILCAMAIPYFSFLWLLPVLPLFLFPLPENHPQNFILPFHNRAPS